MIIGLTYIFSSLALGLIMLMVGLITDKPRRDANVYSYPKKYIWLVFSGLPLLIFVGIALILVSPKESWKHPIIDSATGGTLLFAYSVAWLYVRSFYIRVDGAWAHVGRLFLRKSIALDSIRRFVLIEGGRGDKLLELYDAKNKMVLTATETIQDFADLVAAIRRQMPSGETSFESRDRFGNWIRKKNP